MSTMREHLHGLHKREAQHHLVKSAHHAAVSGHYQKLAATLGKTEVTEAQKDTREILEALAGLHEKLSSEHTEMAAHCHELMEDCSKATDIADLNKTMPLPDGMSVLAPTRSTTPVVRAGGKPLATGANLDFELQKILGNAEEFQTADEPTLRK